MTTADDHIVVTGMGAVSGLGTGCAAHRAALRAGGDGLRPVSRFDTAPFGPTMAGTWPAWDGKIQPQAVDGAHLRQSASDFSTVEMTLVAAREAWAEARLADRGGRRFALVLGTCFGQGFSLFSEVAEAVAHALGITGPVLTISTACSSSTNAIGLGRDLLRAGSADVVLAGGVDILLREVLAGFSALGVVSGEKCAPFSEPYGINLAEGAGIVVMERAGDVHERGAQTLISVDGYGLAADGFHETTPDPTGQGLARAIRWALADAGVAAATIDHVNAHATATESNDRTEWQAIDSALGPRALPVPVSGLKSFLGHAQGAAGVLELILAALAMGDGVLPPTLRFGKARPGAPPDPVPGPLCRPGRVRRALDISSAFGGANAVLVYGAPDAPAEPGPVATAPVPVVVRGLGVVTPLGLGVEALEAAVAAARAVSGRVPAIDLAAILPSVDPRGADPSTVFVTTAAALALQEGGVAMRGSRREESGLFLAATRMPAESARRCHESLRRHGPTGMSAAAFARMSVNAPAGACAKHLSLKGPTTTISVGRGSGLAAVAYAAAWLAQRRDAERLLAAAVDEAADVHAAGAGPPAFEGAVCALLARAPGGLAPGDIALAGWGTAGAGDVAGAARVALGDQPCPDGVWGEGAAGRHALAPMVPDAGRLPLGFLDLAELVAPAEACLSALAFALAVRALRVGRGRSIMVVAASGAASSVAVLLRRS